MRLRSLGVLLVLGMFATLTRAGDDEVRKELDSAYAKSIQSWKDEDIDALGALMTPDFTMKGLDGKTKERAVVLDEWKDLMKVLESIQSNTIKIETLSVKGDEAEVKIREKYAAKLLDKDGKTHPFTGDDTIRDTWVKTKDGWKLKRTEELTSEMTYDGKPFDRNPADD